jgi:hypothetical protein
MANAKHDENSIATLIAVSSADNSTPVRLWADPVTHRLLVDLAGGGVVELTATGTVDGSNQVFTFVEKPSYIVSDHAWYKETNSTGTTNWSWNAGTMEATMTIPPTEDLFGIQ